MPGLAPEITAARTRVGDHVTARQRQCLQIGISIGHTGLRLLRPDDALGAARGAMLIGASLPPVYAQAARLSRRIDALKRTRAELEQQQSSAADTA